MAILDGLLRVDNDTALTVSRASTDVIDLTVVRDIGATESPLMLFFLFGTLPTAAGAATVQIQIQTSPDNSTWTTLIETPAIAYTAFTSRLPTGGVRLILPSITSRYVRLNYIIATGPLTAGSITAAFCEERDMHNYTARNYVV